MRKLTYSLCVGSTVVCGLVWLLKIWEVIEDNAIFNKTIGTVLVIFCISVVLGVIQLLFSKEKKEV